MKVRIDSFPENSADWGAEERFRDASAKAVSQVMRRCRLHVAPSEIAIAFRPPSAEAVNRSKPATGSRPRGPSQDGPSVSKGDTDDADFSGLLSAPRVNAGLLCLNPETMELIQHALDRERVRSLVYERWGLSQIDPFPRTTLNFSGPPGSGKTLAAHYIAEKLGKKILEVTYANVVSKFFGQTPKNLAALFQFASREDAVVFIDEAEPLLSARIGEVSDGADHAINTMRNQLLSVMEKTPIFSIVASNLASSYDKAFESRLLTIHFPQPDQKLSERIWNAHLPDSLPKAGDVTPHFLAAQFQDLNGRQIARAVIEAAHRAAIQDQSELRLQDFEWAVTLVRKSCTCTGFNDPSPVRPR